MQNCFSSKNQQIKANSKVVIKYENIINEVERKFIYWNILQYIKEKVSAMKMNVGEICGILASIVSIVGIAMNEIPIATGLVSLLLGLGIFGIAHEAVQKK
jgi:hypothetical protein